MRVSSSPRHAPMRKLTGLLFSVSGISGALRLTTAISLLNWRLLGDKNGRGRFCRGNFDMEIEETDHSFRLMKPSAHAARYYYLRSASALVCATQRPFTGKHAPTRKSRCSSQVGRVTLSNRNGFAAVRNSKYLNDFVVSVPVPVGLVFNMPRRYNAVQPNQIIWLMAEKAAVNGAKRAVACAESLKSLTREDTKYDFAIPGLNRFQPTRRSHTPGAGRLHR